MNFFFDRCVGRRLARMLDAYDAENTISHQDDDNRFEPTTEDAALIRMIASDQSRPVFVTSDTAMKRRDPERIALADSSLTIVFLRGGWAQLDLHTQACKLLSIWPEIVRQASRCREPTVFEISPQAKKVDCLCKTTDLHTYAQRKRS